MKLLDGQTVGIDLGTAYSAVARLDERGHPAVIENAAGQPITPSVIVLGAGGRLQVGPSGPLDVDDPERVVVAIKREMGNPHYVKVHEGRQLTPEFLSAMILKKLKQDAEARIGTIANAVITVPYYFSDACRRATMNAGSIAGLNVIDIINEPTAATLTYAWLQGELGRRDLAQQEKTILVYDLGGGTFDVTVVRYTPTRFTVVSTDGDSYLGGLDWTQRLLDHVAQRFQEKFGVDPRQDPLARLRLTDECEQAKREVSRSVRTLMNVAYRGRSLAVSLTRSELERLTADLLQRTRDTTELVLELGGVDPQSLDEVLLVGGSTYMPAVQEMLRQVCGREPSHALCPDLAVAQGAAIHAAILEARATGGRGRMGEAVRNRLRNVSAVDVNSHSLGVEITDPQEPARRRNHIMIPRNSPLPSEVRQRFVTTLTNPQGIRIRLLEGEAADPLACTFVGEFRVTNLPPNLPAGTPVEVTYRYDASRRIHVSARELRGNTEASVRIVWESALSDTALNTFRALADAYHVE